MSYAYRWGLISLSFRRKELSDVLYQINNRGPSIEPWGTPKISSIGLDLKEEIWTD